MNDSHNIYFSKRYSSQKTDFREIIFFSIMIIGIFLKFFYVEKIVSHTMYRNFIVVAASIAFSAIFSLTVSLLHRRIRLFFALLISFAFSALALTDVLHIRFYSDIFTFFNLGLSTQVGEVSDSVFALLSVYDFLFFVDTILLFFYYKFFEKISFNPFFSELTWKRVILTSIGILISVFIIFIHISSYEKKVPGVLRSMWDRPSVCNNVGVLTYHFADMKNMSDELLRHRKLAKEQKDGVLSNFRLFGRAFKRTPYFGVAKGKNIIVIQVESLQSFVLGLKFNGVEVTPNLNKFAANAFVFTDIYSQTASGNSSDAEFMANTGFYPAASGVAYTRFAKNKYFALPAALNKAGYNSFAMHADRPAFWNRAHMYPALGFEKFYSKNNYVIDKSIGLGLSDNSFFRQSAVMLTKNKQPFYAFLVTLSSHYPFSFPELLKAAEFNTGEYSGTVTGSYISAIHYLDREFGNFIKALKDNGLYDKSVIIVYGDHTAIPKWDANGLSKLLKNDLNDDVKWRSILTVPFIINLPGAQKIQLSNVNACGHVNIPRTVAELVGVEFNTTLASSVFDETPQPVIFRNGSFIYKNIYVTADKAVDIKTLQSFDPAVFREINSKTKEKLEISDMILEHNLLKELEFD